MDLALHDTTLDLDIVDGDLYITAAGLDSIKQYLRSHLKTFLGEWFLDQDIGIPYIQDIFTKGINPSLIDAIIKNAILEVNGVIELIDYTIDMDPSTRSAKIGFSVRCDDGIIDFNENIEI